MIYRNTKQRGPPMVIYLATIGFIIGLVVSFTKGK